jgi:hypothetical protein
MRLIDRYRKLAQDAYVTDPGISISDVASQIAFILTIAQGREHLARLLALTLAEQAHEYHMEATNPC